MTWLLMVVLCSSILSWAITHRYQEENIELKKKHQDEIDDFKEQIFDVINDNLELKKRLQDNERSKY